MQPETIDRITKLADAANPQRRVITVDREPPHVYFMVGADGAIERRTAAAPPQHAVLLDLASLAAWADEHAGGARVYYSRTGVIVGADPSDPARASARLKLLPSPQLGTLAAWQNAGRADLSQQECITALRVTFAGCWGAYPRLLESVRGVRAVVNQDTKSSIQQGKVSLGKTLEAEMSGIHAVPDEVTFDVPVFAQAAAPARAPVRVAVDPDPQTQRFTLRVLPLDVEAAHFIGEHWLRQELNDLFPDSMIVRGTP